MPPLARGHTAGPGDSARGGHSCHPPPPAAAICHRRGHVVQERGHRAVLGLCPHLWHGGFLSPSARGQEGTQGGLGVLEAKGTSGTIGDVALRVPVPSGTDTGTQGDTRQFWRPWGHQAALGLCPHLWVAVPSSMGTDSGGRGDGEKGHQERWGCDTVGSCPLWHEDFGGQWMVPALVG